MVKGVDAVIDGSVRLSTPLGWVLLDIVPEK
jgi:hypothetical protein